MNGINDDIIIDDIFIFTRIYSLISFLQATGKTCTTLNIEQKNKRKKKISIYYRYIYIYI